MVVELDLHPHRSFRCDEVRLIRKDEAGSPGTQVLLVRGRESREDNLALEDTDDAPDAGLGAVIATQAAGRLFSSKTGVAR